MLEVSHSFRITNNYNQPTISVYNFFSIPSPYKSVYISHVKMGAIVLLMTCSFQANFP